MTPDQQHVYETHADHEPDSQECRQICDGGLGVCKVCNCWEGSLTTECSGAPVDGERQDDVYAGRIDFFGGRWVDTSGAVAAKDGAK
mgnify:CR=1 FL=1